MTNTPKSVLEQISTCWPMINNPVQFVMRYARAIQKYVRAVVKNPDDAEEVAQDFLVRVFDKGFCPENNSRGRFRDYLKTAVRFVAISHLRRKRSVELSDEMLESLVDQDESANQAWTEEWRDCVLGRVWQALELHEQRSPGNLAYTVLKQFTASPDESSESHAAQLSARLGRTIQPAAFRQQLSRARQLFRELIIDEIKQTLHEPTPDSIETELIDLGLHDWVKAATNSGLASKVPPRRT